MIQYLFNHPIMLDTMYKIVDIIFKITYIPMMIYVVYKVKKFD